MRGQANLLALGAAVVVLTAATGIALIFAGGALSTATGHPEERVLATGIAERLVARDSRMIRTDGNLNATKVQAFTNEDLAAILPAGSDAAVRVRLGGEELASTGTPTDGATVTRLVRVVEHHPMIRLPDLSTNESSGSTYVLRAADHIEISINGSAGTLETVWLDGRLVLHDREGLNGTFTVRIPASGEHRLRFGVEQPGEGLVTLKTVHREVRILRLVVTVDA